MSQSRRFSPHTRRRRSGLSTVVSLVLAAAAAALWPARGAAESFLSIFEPHRVVAPALTLDDLRSFSNVPDLSRFTTSRPILTARAATFADPRSAAAAAREALRLPAFLPAGFRPTEYLVVGPSAETIAFHQPAPETAPRTAEVLPADIAATTLRLDFGTLVTAFYAPQETSGSSLLFGMIYVPGSGSERRNPRDARRGDAATSIAFAGEIPLAVAQMAMPRLSSSGVSVGRILAYELDRPGVSARTRAAFATLRDLSTTPAIVAELVANGASIHAVEPARATLEDRFLELLRPADDARDRDAHAA